MPLKSRILRALAAGTLIYRVFWAFSIQTTFVPDEYYQTVEPVNIIFYGASNIGLNSTWEWRDEFRIRSFVPLLPFMLLYQIKFLIGSSLSVLINEVVVLKGPRLVSAVISSYSDFLFYAILKKFTGSDYLAVFITCIHLFSWSGSYCLSRTLANSTETAFLIIGLHFWLLESSGKTCNNEPIQAAATTTLNCSSSESADQTSIRNRTRKRSSSKGKNEFRQMEHTSSARFAEHPEKKTNSKMSSNSCCVPSLAVALIVMTVHCRPTAVLFWAPLILIRSFQKISPWRYIIFHCVPTGVAVLLLCVAVDSICYGRFTVTPFNFFYINITRNYAALFYGVKSWHWNFTHGLPVMLGLYTPFLVPSIVLTPQPEEAIILVIVSLTYVLLLRCVTAHQEYRFLLPVLPFLHIAIGFTLWDLAVWCLPGLGKPPRQPHTVLSYCLSMIGLTSHIRDTALKIGELSESDAYRYSRGDDAKGSVALGGSSIKQNQETTKENGKVVKQAVMPSVGRILCLLLLFLVVIAHLAVAFYLSTRHQRGPEAALIAVAGHINAEHLLVSLKSPEVSHRKVVVLLLAPCHSFPGFGLLPSLIERTGWTVQLFSPDCSPSVRIPSSTFCKDDTCPAQDARADAGAEVRTESESVAVGGTMTESKRFESDPALFLSSIGLSDAHYAITFNSFHDVIWPLLSKEGFRPLSDVPHADLRYDYDDPHFHHTVHVLHRSEVSTSPISSDSGECCQSF